MKSTGEVMGVGVSFCRGFRQEPDGGQRAPAPFRSGVHQRQGLGQATSRGHRPRPAHGRVHPAGDARYRGRHRRGGHRRDAVNKVTEGRPHVVDMIKNNEIVLIINTVDEKRTAISDSRSIRTSGLAAQG
jgi:carbamoyl-phosphate synthase large subunit